MLFLQLAQMELLSITNQKQIQHMLLTTTKSIYLIVVVNILMEPPILLDVVISVEKHLQLSKKKLILEYFLELCHLNALFGLLELTTPVLHLMLLLECTCGKLVWITATVLAMVSVHT
jgi:hypothetical protein